MKGWQPAGGGLASLPACRSQSRLGLSPGTGPAEVFDRDSRGVSLVSCQGRMGSREDATENSACCGEIKHERQGMRASWSSSVKKASAAMTLEPQGWVVKRVQNTGSQHESNTPLLFSHRFTITASPDRRTAGPPKKTRAGLTPGGNRTENRKEDRGAEARVAAGAETETHEDDWEATHSATIRKPIS